MGYNGVILPKSNHQGMVEDGMSGIKLISWIADIEKVCLLQETTTED